MLPAINSVDGATKAMAAITTAVANGELTPTEAAELSRVIDGYIKSIEATEIERRLRLLEERVIPTFAFFSPWGVSSRALNLADPAACEAKRALLVMANAWLMLAVQRSKNIEYAPATSDPPSPVNEPPLR